MLSPEEIWKKHNVHKKSVDLAKEISGQNVGRVIK